MDHELYKQEALINNEIVIALRDHHSIREPHERRNNIKSPTFLL